MITILEIELGHSFGYTWCASVSVPEPYQAGCHPVEGEVGVRVSTGRWGTNRWATIEPLQHPYVDGL